MRTILDVRTNLTSTFRGEMQLPRLHLAPPDETFLAFLPRPGVGSIFVVGTHLQPIFSIILARGRIGISHCEEMNRNIKGCGRHRAHAASFTSRRRNRSVRSTAPSHRSLNARARNTPLERVGDRRPYERMGRFGSSVPFDAWDIREIRGGDSCPTSR